jgi:cyclophilin family peptidyl-prolyl cis-trans isomerase
MKRYILAACAVAIAALLVAQDLPDGLYAKIGTDRGDIVLKLEYERAPLTVCNFVGLAEGTLPAAKGKKYYDGLVFHRVIENFMIQSGDPTGTGSGGPGYRFQDEIDPGLKHDRPGTLSMANSGPNTNGSQFFITHVSTPWLDGKHAVFGYVQSGQEVVNAIQKGDVMRSVTIIRVGGKARGFKADQKAFQAYQASLKERGAAAKSEALSTQFAEIVKRWPGLEKGEDGIFFKVLKEGQGTKPRIGETVSILYKGMLPNGKVFDSSESHGNAPLKFKIGAGEIIVGLDAAARSMRKGEKRVVALPPDKAFGEAGSRDMIPANSFLVFELELRDITQ